MKAASSPTRDSYHHGDLRNALLETAARLVAERGPEGFSLREAAREVGVSPLMAALAVEGHARLATQMERALAKVPCKPGTKAHAVAAFAAIGEAYVDFAVRHPSHFRVMFGPCLEEEGFAPGLAPSGRDAFQILVDVLDALVTAGAVDARARAGAEIAAWSGVHGMAALLVEGALPLPPRGRADAVRGLARTLLVGLGCDPALAPAPGAPVDGDPCRPQRPPRR